MTKAVCLYSGGLDSILAIHLVLKAAELKIVIIPIKFITPFFDYKNKEELEKEAAYLKERFNIKLRTVDLTNEYLRLLDKPKHGFGKNLNPCIDCKILMLEKAKEIMQKEKAEFIFSGEVVGQRPKSQMRDKLLIIEKEAALENILLRPLSAKLLKETAIEKKGILNREKLYDISGRSRSVQLTLAQKFDIRYFTTPSGGCLLTDHEYARKLKIIKEKIKLNSHLVKFLKWGRVFIIKNKLFVVGRNDDENKKLLYLAENRDLIIQPKEIPGPLCVFICDSKVSGHPQDGKFLKVLCSICAKYTLKRDSDKDKKILVQYGEKSVEMATMVNLRELILKNSLRVKAASKEEIRSYSI